MEERWWSLCVCWGGGVLGTAPFCMRLCVYTFGRCEGSARVDAGEGCRGMCGGGQVEGLCSAEAGGGGDASCCKSGVRRCAWCLRSVVEWCLSCPVQDIKESSSPRASP